MPELLTIFVYEFLTAGAYRDELRNSPLLTEGRAMAESIIADFASLVDCRVITVWSRTLSPVGVPGVEVYSTNSPDEEHEQFEHCCRTADAILIIAPESNNILSSQLARAREIQQDTVINVTDRALEVGCDKWELAKFCRLHDVPHLPTELWRGQAVSQLPAIIKPRDGAGCEGILLTSEISQASTIPLSDDLIIQPWREGIALSSAACFSPNGERLLTLPLAEQKLNITQQIQYRGGSIPWSNAKRELAEQQASLILEELTTELTGLSGYLGFDWLWEEESETLRLVEINPRLTTSYIGYRELFGNQIVNALLGRPSNASLREHSAVTFSTAGAIDRTPAIEETA